MPPNFIIDGEAFPLVTSAISVGDTEVPMALVPYDEANLDRIVKLRGLRERVWPYWLEEWPATYALAEALDKEDSALWSAPVLDLGCGAGFLAAYLRIRFVIRPFSCDFNADACRLASLNARPLDPQPAPGLGRVFCADFSAFPSRARFGLVFAGEMLYTRANHRPILDFLQRHLAPKGLAYFADPGRSSAEGFEVEARAAGFQIEVGVSPMRGKGRNMHVYKLYRNPGQ
jgi:SAM-dependent methyltransferase